ncbi:MAG: CGGC domain-containing protein [Spirochaetes bacterium]|nr:CGGC domain-containing protein [Spirochaetota bacterium]MBU0956944.1 CGGC domain-containing protein [Spirochaetota bacterium]
MSAERIGIIICNRYHNCAGGKCFRAFRNREGAFSIYKNAEAEIAGYTSCGGCPGANIEYLGEEMAKNGITSVHLATGLLVGYPPCPNIDYFSKYLHERYNFKVVSGTHPIPEKYKLMHEKLNTWNAPIWDERLQATMNDQETRLAYN